MPDDKARIGKGVDGILIALYFLLVGIGLMSIFAVTYREGDPIVSSFFTFKTGLQQTILFLHYCFGDRYFYFAYGL